MMNKCFCLFQIAGKIMHNLGCVFAALKRHSDALAMFERVLELYRRVLPEDHPEIGERHKRSCVAIYTDGFVDCDAMLSIFMTCR